MGVPELNVGDVIGVVKSVVHGECDGCMFADTASHCMIQCLPDCMLKLRDGPKQGDTVWGSNGNVDWVKGVFIGEYANRFIIGKDNKLYTYNYMTITDPYALKYELTPQEALVAIGQGKKVRDLDMGDDQYFEWIDGKGITLNGSVGWDLDLSMKYAIVEG